MKSILLQVKDKFNVMKNVLNKIYSYTFIELLVKLLIDAFIVPYSTVYFGMTKAMSGKKGEQAILHSKPLSPTAPKCKLQFSYFYNTTPTATLYVTVAEDINNSTVYSTILQTPVTRSSEWRTVQMGLGYRRQGINNTI